MTPDQAAEVMDIIIDKVRVPNCKVDWYRRFERECEKSPTDADPLNSFAITVTGVPKVNQRKSDPTVVMIIDVLEEELYLETTVSDIQVQLADPDAFDKMTKHVEFEILKVAWWNT